MVESRKGICVKRFTVYITPTALKEAKRLPGNVRQRIREAIDNLEDDPRPSKSKALDVRGLPVKAEIRRLRIERWRVLFAINENESIVDVLAIRKRPPYDYGDLSEILGELPER